MKKAAFTTWWLLFAIFALIPVANHIIGFYFQCESYNALASLFWYLIPYLMLICLLLMRQWLLGLLGAGVCLLWTPVVILCLYLFGTIEAVKTNANKSLYDSKPLSGPFKNVRVCKYAFSGGATARGHWKQTLEKEIFPGIKHVAVIDVSDEPL